MSQNVDVGFKTLQAGGAIAKYLRVRITGGKLAAAGIADTDDIGTIEEAAFADLDYRAVRLYTCPGTRKMIAAAAIVKGAKVWSAASGKVSVSAATAFIRGIAMEAAAADGDVIEVMPIIGETAV